MAASSSAMVTQSLAEQAPSTNFIPLLTQTRRNGARVSFEANFNAKIPIIRRRIIDDNISVKLPLDPAKAQPPTTPALTTAPVPDERQKQFAKENLERGYELSTYAQKEMVQGNR